MNCLWAELGQEMWSTWMNRCLNYQPSTHIYTVPLWGCFTCLFTCVCWGSLQFHLCLCLVLSSLSLTVPILMFLMCLLCPLIFKSAPPSLLGLTGVPRTIKCPLLPPPVLSSFKENCSDFGRVECWTTRAGCRVLRRKLLKRVKISWS